MTSRRILLVEDNPDDVALTIRALKKNKFANEVIVAQDGAEALEIVFSEDSGSRPPPGLILLDLNLPKIEGLEVLRRIRADQRTRRLPVVVLTSSVLEEDIVSAYQSGANAFIRKPVDFAEFTEAVSTVGMFWLLLNETPPR